MKFIDEEIIAFCTNPNEHFFKLSEHSDQIRGNKGFWKATLSDNMVALFLTTEEQFNALLHGDIEMIGFFCSVTEKLYMYDSFQYSFNLQDPRMGLPFHYETVPIYKMKEQLTLGVAEKLRKPVLPVGFNLAEEDTYKFAASEYFSSHGNYQATPGDLYGYVSDSNLVAEIPKFLTDPHKWILTTYEAIAQNESVMRKLVAEMNTKSEIQAVCEMVRHAQNHPWNRILRFYDAIKDKSTVIVRLKKNGETCEFRLPVDRCSKIWRYSDEGSAMPLVFADYCNPTKPEGSHVMNGNVDTDKRYRLAKEFLDDGFIYIKDIDAMLYRGKEIFK